MGIQGLLPFLKNGAKPANIKDFKGCTVAIDSYCWLHKGAFGCAEKLALGEKTDQYVHYCLKYINNLLSFGIKPIMVFDGCHLPSKKEVEKQRREKRATHRKKAAQFLREGKRKEARDSLVQCIDITSQMALELMEACRSKGVDCIVAPYEADAQLAYLNKIGVAQIVITEDSDLILFGCEKIMYKMDISGNGMLIEKKDLNQAIGVNANADHFTFDKFRHMCILSGCDYLTSLPGVGLARALKALKLTRQTDMRLVLKKLPSLMRSNNLKVDQVYIEGFIRADNTFLYQLVYDPLQRSLVPLTPYPPELDLSDLSYAGPWISESKALQIALGNIDIYTGEKISDFNPEAASWESVSQKQANVAAHLRSIWDPTYKPVSHSQTAGENVVSRPSTRGLEFTARSEHLLKKTSAQKRSHETTVKEDTRVWKAEMGDLYDSMPASHVTPPAKKLCRSESFSLLDKTNEPQTTEKRSMSVNNVDIASPEKILKSPRNKFAAKTPKKGSFSLNAEKNENLKVQVEVKSRFFAGKQPLKKTSFFKELDKNHIKAKNAKMRDFVFHGAQDDTTPQPSSDDEEEEAGSESGDADVVVMTTNSTPTVLSEADCSSVVTIVCGDVDVEDDNINSSQTSNKSSNSVFSKLSHFKSEFDHKNARSVSPVLSCSKSASQQFKPVADPDILSVQRSGFSYHEADASQDSRKSDMSQSVGLYSFDADDWKLSQSQGAERSLSLLSSSQESCSEMPLLPLLPRSPSPSSRSSVTSEISGVAETVSALFNTSKSSKSVATKLSAASSGARTDKASKKFSLGSCKAVGLTRKQAKKSPPSNKTKGRKSNENQPAISKYFSETFSYQKRSLDKIVPAEPKVPLSPTKNN